MISFNEALDPKNNLCFNWVYQHNKSYISALQLINGHKQGIWLWIKHQYIFFWDRNRKGLCDTTECPVWTRSHLRGLLTHLNHVEHINSIYISFFHPVTMERGSMWWKGLAHRSRDLGREWKTKEREEHAVSDGNLLFVTDSSNKGLSPVINCWPVHDLPLLSPEVSWVWVQLSNDKHK